MSKPYADSEIGAIYVKIAAVCDKMKELERELPTVFDDYLKIQEEAADNGISFSISMSETVSTAISAYRKQREKEMNRQWRQKPIRPTEREMERDATT